MADPQTEQPAQPGSGRLWFFGYLIVVPAIYFAWRYPLAGRTTQLVDIGKIAHYTVATFVLYVGGITLMTIGYCGAVLAARGVRLRTIRLPVMGISTLLLGAFATLYPVNAIDMFIYAVRSYLLTNYGANPNAVRPQVYWDTDQFVHFASWEWASATSPYGPLWNVIAAPVTAISDSNIGQALTGFKVLVVLAALGAAWFIYQTVHLDHPDYASAAALAWLWNPLLLWEGIGNGHNDVVVMFFVVAAIYCWRAGRNGWVIPLLVASVLVKYVTVLLLPIVIVMLWRRHTMRQRLVIAVQSAIASAVLAYIALYPYFDIQALRESIKSQSGLIMSSPLAGLILMANRWHWSLNAAETGKRGAEIIVALTLLWSLWLLIRDRIAGAHAMVLVMSAYVAVAAWNFRPWYLIWIVALTALLPVGWPFWRCAAWTLGALLSYSHYIWLREWWPGDSFSFELTGIAFSFVPVLLVVLAELIAQAGWVSLPLGSSRTPESSPPLA